MIRIGIVGCGRILAAHLRGYRLLREAGVEDFQIAALCARKEEDARMYIRRGEGPPQRPPVSDIPGDPLAIGDEYLSDFQPDVPVEVYTDYRRMMAEAPIDAVNDFTTHELHHQVAQAAFEYGKHLLTQKPLAVSVAAARWMCQEAQRRGLVFGVFENFRQNEQTRYLTWAFGPQGPLGPLQMLYLGYVATWWAPDLVVAQTPWRHRRLEGGGLSLDLGVHFFDQIRQVAGEVTAICGQTAVVEPRRVIRDAQGNVVQQIDCDADDTFFAAFESTSGAVGNLCASWAGRGGPTRMGQGTVWYGAGGRVTGNEVTLADGTSAALDELFWSQAPEELKQRWFPLGLRDSFALNQLDWLQAIRQGTQPETSGQEGLRDLACAFAILESATAGRRVTVDEVLSGQANQYQQEIDRRYGFAG